MGIQFTLGRAALRCKVGCQARDGRRACVTESVGATAPAFPLAAKLMGAVPSRGAPSSGAGAAAALFAQVIWKLWMYRASNAASQYAK